MSDPSHPDTPAPEDSAASDPGAPLAPEQSTTPPSEPTAPEAPTPPSAPPAEPAPAPAAPQFVQPYPGAAPVPVAGAQPSGAAGAPAGPPAAAPAAPQPPAAAQPPSAQPAAPTTPLPPYAAASGYPGAPGGYPASASVPPAGPYTPPAGQAAPPAGPYGAPAAPPGQYGAPAGQYPPAGGSIPPGHTPAPGSVPPGPGKPADTRPKTLGVIALCLAIGGAVLAFIPLVNLISIPLLIAAIVLAIIALVSKKQGGTGFSIAALIVSVVAGLAAIIVAIVSIFVLTLGGIAAIEDSVPDDSTIEPYPGEGDADAEYGADQDLTVLETAFGDSGDGSWWYAVIIENPNDDAVFDYEDLTVTALDAGGVELATNDEYLTILPGTVAIVGYFDGLTDVQISELEIGLPDAENGYLVDPADLGELTVDGISATADSSTTTVTGTVTSTFSDDADYVVVSVIARDAAGTIVNAARGYAEAVPAGGSGPFDVLFYPALTDGMTLEAYPAL
ncbi:MAG: hypothetical protein NT132_07960 [Microbacterium sp.]|uniref:hypothetical protein n=1 Tax=Microbacterium sp. TaxID=51671 RepID=UPI00263605BD|nr:hypothetical protein [Microbacterium sp.]MCX6502321.1 hypothetical protein [Microbacterium sp.]